MGIKRRYYLRRTEVRRLCSQLGAANLAPAGVEAVELQDGRTIYLSQGKPIAFKTPEGTFPALSLARRLKRVKVDLGAVPPIARGADVMAPGVTWADETISPGECVAVVDERHGRELAVGIALVEGHRMLGPRGKVIKVLHHVGDEIWRTGAQEKVKIRGNRGDSDEG